MNQKPEKKASLKQSEITKQADEKATVRGSGFTYDEAKDRTDESEPIETAEKQEMVDLPDLGKPNRP